MNTPCLCGAIPDYDMLVDLMVCPCGDYQRAVVYGCGALSIPKPEPRIDSSKLFDAAAGEHAVYNAFRAALTALGWNYDIRTDAWQPGRARADKPRDVFPRQAMR